MDVLLKAFKCDFPNDNYYNIMIKVYEISNLRQYLKTWICIDVITSSEVYMYFYPSLISLYRNYE